MSRGKLFSKNSGEQIKNGLRSASERISKFIKNEYQTRNDSKKKLLKKVAILGAATLLATPIVSAVKPVENVREQKSITMDNDEENQTSKDYVITYQYTNQYKEIPDYNKPERLLINDIIEYDSENDCYRNPKENDDGTISWLEVEEGENMSAASWIYHTNDKGEDRYVPSVNVDKYEPYKIKAGSKLVNIRAEATTSSDSIGQIYNGQVAYVDTTEVYEVYDSSVDKSYHWCRAILKDETNSEYPYISGYVATDLLEKDNEITECIGVINNNTYDRTYPLVTELQEELILSQKYNGETIEVVEVETDNSGAEWLKCEGEDGYYFISALAAKDKSEYETEARIKGDDVEISSATGAILCSVDEGTKVKVDLESEYDGLYQVYYEDKQCTGYVNKENLDLDIELTTTDKQNNSESQETTDISSESSQEQQISGEIKTIDDKISYVVDVSNYTKIDDYKKTIKELKKNGLQVAMFEIGRSSQDNTTQGSNYFMMASFIDNEDKDYEDGQPKQTAVEKKYAQIRENYLNACGDKLYYNKKDDNHTMTPMGSIENLEAYVSAAIEEGLDIAWYYYTTAVTPNQASAEAAQIYAINKKLQDDLGDKYDKANTGVISIDIETAGKYRNQNKEGRTNAIIEIIKLLSNGTDNENCWCIDGINPQEGYNITKVPTIYIDIDSLASGEFITSLEDIKKGLNNDNIFMWYTRATNDNWEMAVPDNNGGLSHIYLNNDEAFNTITDDENVLKVINENKYLGNSVNKWNSSSIYYENCEKLKEADMLQYALNAQVSGQDIDLSIVSQKTWEEVCNGTYIHDTDFLTQLEEAYENEQEKSNSKSVNENNKNTDDDRDDR